MKELRKANIKRNIEWVSDAEPPSLSFRGNELAGEVGEACNIIKKLERVRLGMRGSRASKEELAQELADVIICTDLLAMDAGIDLNQAVIDKFNATSEKYNLDTKLSPHQYCNTCDDEGKAIVPFDPKQELCDCWVCGGDINLTPHN